jgi:hypothetical protein
MTQSPEVKLAGFLGKYTEEVQAQFRLARTRLRKLFPRGFELVYDNYNALAVGYSPAEGASHAVVSIAAYPRWVTLFFLKGAVLPDPAHRLQGAGSTVRSIKLLPLATIDEAEVQVLLQKAIEPYREEFAAASKLQTIIKSVSARQRPRTPGPSALRKTAKRPGGK